MIDTTHALDTLPGPRVMVQGEADVLDLFRALQADSRGSAALVRLRDDLEQMIQAATFPVLAAEKRGDKDALTKKRDDLLASIDTAEGREALRIADEIDDLDEQIEYADDLVLRCPVCNEIVEAEALVAVDVAERWTYADEIDSSDSPNRQGVVSLSFDGDADFGDTLYLSHGDPGGRHGHPVALPEGWEVQS